MLRHYMYQMQNINNHVEFMLAFDQEPHFVVTIEPLHIRPSYLKPAQLKVPISYIQEGEIVLNMDMNGLQNFEVDVENGILTFSTYFQGVVQKIVLPMEHIKVVRNSPKEPVYGFTYVSIPAKEFWSAVPNPYFKEPENKEEHIPVAHEKPTGRPALKLV